MTIGHKKKPRASALAPQAVSGVRSLSSCPLNSFFYGVHQNIKNLATMVQYVNLGLKQKEIESHKIRITIHNLQFISISMSSDVKHNELGNNDKSDTGLFYKFSTPPLNMESWVQFRTNFSTSKQGRHLII